MSRFVIASFLFLGWGFYEFSGGADFEPPKGPSAAADIAKATFSSDTGTGDAAVRSRTITAESLVSKVALRSAQEDGVIQSASTRSTRPAADPNLRTRVAMEQIAAVGDGIGDSDAAFSVNKLAFQTDTDGAATLQLASLSEGLSALPVAQAAANTDIQAQEVSETETDIRTITATRVNMRSGPGTVYPILKRLTNGEEVSVFEDIGTGWLHLRTVKGGTVGWIAASLVSQKRP
ncbi:SH3 domain-containing protein [Phaeobacter sp. C3_T13_0]|uniref:SH3 domain-containing protein n=1 Tax=Phaeobacter cretensis TaxID=3342641 RepID=UPI0039BD3282